MNKWIKVVLIIITVNIVSTIIDAFFNVNYREILSNTQWVIRDLVLICGGAWLGVTLWKDN